MRQLFLRLVTPGRAADTRRRVERAELDTLDVDQGRLALSIDAYGAARLLSFDRDPRTEAPTVEVAHEALLSRWARLKDWIAAARDDLRAHQRLSSAAREWRDVDRDPSLLMRGAQLERFESWAAESGIAQTDLEREYLAESVAAREAERLAEEARQARETALERRSIHRLRALVGVLAVAALVAAGLTVFAFQQSNHSKHEAKIATARQLAAASAANIDVDPELSILLGLRAVETTGGGAHALPEAVDALHRAVEASRAVATIPVQAAAVAFSPDGTRLATAGSSVGVWSTKTGRRLFDLGRGAGPFNDVAFSADGRRLAAGGSKGLATIWDATNGRRLESLESPVGGTGIYALAFDPEGKRIAADDGVGDLWLWDAGSRRVIRTIRTAHPLCGVSWSPDGGRVATGDCGTHYAGSVARIWDARPAGSCSPARSRTVRSVRSRTARTASTSGRRTDWGSPGSSISPPAAPSPGSRTTRARCSPSHSAPAAIASSPAARTVRRVCGRLRPGGSCSCCGVIVRPCPPWPSLPGQGRDREPGRDGQGLGCHDAGQP